MPSDRAVEAAASAIRELVPSPAGILLVTHEQAERIARGAVIAYQRACAREMTEEARRLHAAGEYRVAYLRQEAATRRRAEADRLEQEADRG